MTMSPSVADQIREFQGTQPADCLAVNLDRLARALLVTGPVVHRGRVVSAREDRGGFAVDFEERDYAPPPPVLAYDDHGEIVETPAPEPTDHDLAKQWGLPVARDVPLPAAPSPSGETPAGPPAD